MPSLRIFPVFFAALVACGDPGREEQPVRERSPYGELEVARAEEAGRPRSARASHVVRAKPPAAEPAAAEPAAAEPVEPVASGAPGSRVPADSAEPPAGAAAADTGVLADSTAPADSAVVAGTGVPADSADTIVLSDTAAYEQYPSATPEETVSTERPDTVAAPPPPLETPAPAAPARTVPAGTVIHAAFEDSIHSRHDVSGKVVTAKVMQNVTAPDGRTLIPAGTPVLLTVTQVKPGRGDRKGVLEIRADSIAIGGEPLGLEARLQPVSHQLRGRGVTAEEAAKDVVVKSRTPFALVLTAPIALAR